MQAGETKRVILLGLDFGSTTSSALLASAKIARSSATGHMQLDDVKVLYKSEPVFTPFANQNIDIEKVAKLIANWFAESGVKVAEIFSGGSMITGLAAQAHNAAALSKLISSIVGESVRPIICGIPMICRYVTYPLSLDFFAIQQHTNGTARLLWLPIANKVLANKLAPAIRSNKSVHLQLK